MTAILSFPGRSALVLRRLKGREEESPGGVPKVGRSRGKRLSSSIALVKGSRSLAEWRKVHDAAKPYKRQLHLNSSRSSPNTLVRSQLTNTNQLTCPTKPSAKPPAPTALTPTVLAVSPPRASKFLAVALAAELRRRRTSYASKTIFFAFRDGCVLFVCGFLNSRN